MNEEILQRIDALAAKLGVVGEHLWAVLVKQVQVDVIVASGVLGLWTALSILWYVTNRAAIKKHGFSDAMEFGVGRTIFFAMLVVVGIIVWSACSPVILTGLLNPEYAALKKLPW